MRNSFEGVANSVVTEELLTTGEAAALLGVSRQHVVDLGSRGDLEVFWVGKHRRVRRAEVEELRTTGLRMTRDQRRSLWLAFAIAGKVVVDPSREIAKAREVLDRQRTASRVNKWLGEWARLLDGPVERLLTELTATTNRGRELRQNSPFVDTLSATERDAVIAAFREARGPE